jgi:hypothetical protein
MKSKDKPVASISMMEEVIRILRKCPDSDMEKHVKDKILEFTEKEHNPGELYDFLQWVSDRPVVKINEKICVGDVSTFVKALCNMKKFYLRPN